MTWLMEDPWIIVLAGVAAEIILGVLLLKTGRGAILGAMLAVLVLTGVLLVIERLVVTEGEQVQATLEGVAAAAVRRDPDEVLAFISPSSESLRSYAAGMLRRAVIREVHIGRDLDIQLSPGADPPTATARFTVRVRGADTRENLPYDNFVGALKVDLRKEGGQWLIVDFEPLDNSRIGRPRTPGRDKP